MSEPGTFTQGLLMDEARRQAYLAALGVDLYLARQPLPHAAPSWLSDWEAESHQDSDASFAGEETYADWAQSESAIPSPGTMETTPPVRPTIDALTANTALSAAASARPMPGVTDPAQLTVPVLRNLKPEAAGTSRPATPKPVSLQVGLAVFEWPGQLRVLIEMADPDAPSLSSKEHRLWNEIALAVYGREQAYDAQSIPIFRFPPSPNLRHLETPEGVRDGVEGFLQMRHSRSPVKLQIFFAGSGLAAAFLGERGAQVDQPQGLALTNAGAGLLLPSFAQLMDNARLKPLAWQGLVAALRQAGVRA